MLSKSTSFSFHDNFPSNFPQMGSTLSSHMLYIPSAPSGWPNLLQKSFLFPTCLPSWCVLAALYPSQTILTTLKSLKTPLQASSLLPRLIRSLHPRLTGWVWRRGESWERNFSKREQCHNLTLGLCYHGVLSSSPFHSAKEMCWLYRIPTCSML